mmetsp:Transcript_34891/g.33950  ORF Transcript_34891/g.33950 Transcript_34891/m.33950 type:complete len:81 (-) Transcript_34891:70-312(-)
MKSQRLLFIGLIALCLAQLSSQQIPGNCETKEDCESFETPGITYCCGVFDCLNGDSYRSCIVNTYTGTIGQCTAYCNAII